MSDCKCGESDCKPCIHDNLGLDISLSVIVFIGYCVVLIQFIITPLKSDPKNITYFRYLMFIGATLQLIFAILHPISMQNYEDKVVGTIARYIHCILYCIIIYYILKV